MKFKTVHKKLDAAMKLDENKAWFFAIDNGVKEEIVQLNTIDQLFDKGIDSLNKSLGKYANTTIELYKKPKGQKYSNITLKDTGDFYRSFKVEVTKDSIKINANPIKEDNNLFDDFGAEIVGLTTQNRMRVSEMILNKIIIYVKKQLQI
jgi:pectin methylesterase-like acyl-CoA thioesterase